MRIAHLSDLHFGLHRADLVDPLLAQVNGARPDVIVLTGDLTHRSRLEQWREATEFLARLEAPVLCVPGNHDIPAWNPLARVVIPFAAYRRNVGAPTDVEMQFGRVSLQGVNTADPLAWDRGRISKARADEVIARLRTAALNIVALHHPMQQRPEVRRELMRGAPEALHSFERGGVDIVLSGHLHRWAAAELLGQGRRTLQIHAGTALCSRPGDKQNEFAILDLHAGGLTATRHIAPMDQQGFQQPVTQNFLRQGGLWRAEAA